MCINNIQSGYTRFKVRSSWYFKNQLVCFVEIENTALKSLASLSRPTHNAQLYPTLKINHHHHKHQSTNNQNALNFDSYDLLTLRQWRLDRYNRHVKLVQCTSYLRLLISIYSPHSTSVLFHNTRVAIAIHPFIHPSHPCLRMMMMINLPVHANERTFHFVNHRLAIKCICSIIRKCSFGSRRRYLSRIHHA